MHANSDILLIDQAGKIIRLPGSEVRTMGRQAKGVRLIRLDDGQKLASIAAFEEHDVNGENNGSENSGSENSVSGNSSSSVPVRKMADFVPEPANEPEDDQESELEDGELGEDTQDSHEDEEDGYIEF